MKLTGNSTVNSTLNFKSENLNQLEIYSLSNIKEIIFSNNLNTLTELTLESSHWLDDEHLEIIKKSLNLKKLHIRGSKITNFCINNKFLLDLDLDYNKYLTTVKLNVMNLKILSKLFYIIENYYVLIL